MRQIRKSANVSGKHASSACSVGQCKRELSVSRQDTIAEQLVTRQQLQTSRLRRPKSCDGVARIHAYTRDHVEEKTRRRGNTSRACINIGPGCLNVGPCALSASLDTLFMRDKVFHGPSACAHIEQCRGFRYQATNKPWIFYAEVARRSIF